jgi:DNA-binding response OmpR family regulator
MSLSQPTICIIEDDPAIATMLDRVVTQTGYRAAVFGSAEMALDTVHLEAPSLVIADVNLPQIQGPAMIEQLRAKGVRCPVLFVSGDSSLETLESSLRFANASFLPKPFTPAELTSAIWSALKQR